MKRIIRKPLKILLGIIAIILFCFITMLLWNALIPAIFGLPVISFIQAAGLLILFRILFGHGRFGNHHWRRHYYMREKWANMTPEERKNFCSSRFTHFHDMHDKPETEKQEGTEASKTNI
jgi:hypothetical protein